MIFFSKIQLHRLSPAFVIFFLLLNSFRRYFSSSQILITVFQSTFSLTALVILCFLFQRMALPNYRSMIAYLISSMVFLLVSFLQSSIRRLQVSASSASSVLSPAYCLFRASTASRLAFRVYWFIQQTLFLPNSLQLSFVSSTKSLRMASRTGFLILACRLSNTFKTLQGLFCFSMQSKTISLNQASSLLAFDLLSFFFFTSFFVSFFTSFLPLFPFPFSASSFLLLHFYLACQGFVSLHSDSVSLIIYMLIQKQQSVIIFKTVKTCYVCLIIHIICSYV